MEHELNDIGLLQKLANVEKKIACKTDEVWCPHFQQRSAFSWLYFQKTCFKNMSLKWKVRTGCLTLNIQYVKKMERHFSEVFFYYISIIEIFSTGKTTRRMKDSLFISMR